MRSVLARLAIVSSVFFICGSSYFRTHAIFDIEAMSQALNLYKRDYGRYPDAIDKLASPEKLQYLAYVPLDPWGNAYKYANPSVHGKLPYDLYSFGMNGKDDAGSNDDISNWQGYDAVSYPVPLKWDLISIVVAVVMLFVWVTIFISKRLKNFFFKA